MEVKILKLFQTALSLQRIWIYCDHNIMHLCFEEGEEKNQSNFELNFVVVVVKVGFSWEFSTKNQMNFTFTIVLHWVAYDSDGDVVNSLANRLWLTIRYCCGCYCFRMVVFYRFYRYCVCDDLLWVNLFWMNDDVLSVWSVERWPLFLDQNNYPVYRSIHRDSLL